MADSTVTSTLTGPEKSKQSSEKDRPENGQKLTDEVTKIISETKKGDLCNGSKPTFPSPVAGPSWKSSSASSSTTCSSTATSSSPTQLITRKRPQPFCEKVNQLVEMGLNENVAKKALLFTGNCSISLAINWALDHSTEDVNGSLEKFVPSVGFTNGHSKQNGFSNGHSKQNGNSKSNGFSNGASNYPCNRKVAPSSTVVSPEEDGDDSEEEEDSDEMDEEDFEDFDLEHEEEEEGEVRKLQGAAASSAQTFNNKGACARAGFTSSSDDYDELEEGEIHRPGLPGAASRLSRPQVEDSSEEEDEDGEELTIHKVCIVVNGGLHMSAGRVAKQVAHAMMGLCRIVEQSKDPCIVCEFGYWQELGEEIAIVKGNSTVHLRDLRQIAEDLDMINFLVESPEHTLDKNGHATVLSVFGNEENLDNIMGRLPSF